MDAFRGSTLLAYRPLRRWHPRACGRVALLGVVLLGGCAAPVVEAALVVRDQATYRTNLAAATAGNAEAEFKVGNALCCSVSASQPFYNTQRATEWLCRAAIHGNRDAMFRLGRIHDGDLVNGVRLSRRLSNAVADAPTHPVAAWTWFSLAAAAGAPDGAKRAAEVQATLSASDLARARVILAAGAVAAPCTETQVAHGV